jgi:hypothetical protein
MPTGMMSGLGRNSMHLPLPDRMTDRDWRMIPSGRAGAY